MRELGKRSKQVQQARRLAALAEESGEATTGSIGAGDAIGLLEFRDFRSGRITRWTECRGNRVNNFTLKTPDGRQSKPHGLAWLLAKVRPILLGKRFSHS